MTTTKRFKVHQKTKLVRKMLKRSTSRHLVPKNQTRLRVATVLPIAAYAWVLSMGHHEVLEEPQCSHTANYECLLAYSAQYLRNIRARDLQCPACSQPLPVSGEPTFRDEENDEGSEGNAFKDRNDKTLRKRFTTQIVFHHKIRVCNTPQ
ncbi:hypothetical protein GN958_ATG13078 [Phytophthora infestans]|uniref:Uncharacterized protein n=1 Tax=Phytophthora infestans TaxID=4787 RepID=A0A8S9UA29_PHYIN|nr:hypothetical protein GN958_ATG13078 [Phytophthora infestans]